jgi:hypothetical protein
VPAPIICAIVTQIPNAATNPAIGEIIMRFVGANGSCLTKSMHNGSRVLWAADAILMFDEIIGQRHVVSHHLKVAADRRSSSFGAIKSAVL